MRVLVTNDDGIAAPGLRALAEAARSRGHVAVVAAPCWDYSGASASVTGVTNEGDVLFERRDWDGWGEVFAVQATPALICRAALHGLFGPSPDVVLSGINHGANTGRAIIHSGTVGAAFTAYVGLRPAVAVSLAVAVPSASSGHNWQTAATVAGQVLDWLIALGRPLVVNCNVPDVPLGELRGIKVGHLAVTGAAQTFMTEEEGEPYPVTVLARSGPAASGPSDATPEVSEPPSDVALLRQGYASVTALRPVEEDTSADLSRVGYSHHRPQPR